MHLTRRTDYALRMIMLAPEPEGTPLSLSAIASKLRLSRNHLHKVAQQLAAIGVLESRSGRAGGIRLVAGALEMTVGDIVRQLEPLAIVECMQHASKQEPGFVLDSGCSLKSLLARAQQSFVAQLDDVTLGHLIRSNRPLIATIGFGPRMRAP